MNAEIMAVSNTLFYSGRLTCATERVATARLQLGGAVAASSPAWLVHALDVERPVVWLDTDALGSKAHEVRTLDSLTNQCEVALVSLVTDALVGAGVALSGIGILSPYRSQLRAIRDGVGSHGEALEVHTVDKFQGRDKDVIIFSCVRANAVGDTGALLADWRRLNVAFTRARTKLIVIGSTSTLVAGGKPLKPLVELVRKRGWVVPVSAVGAEQKE